MPPPHGRWGEAARAGRPSEADRNSPDAGGDGQRLSRRAVPGPPTPDRPAGRRRTHASSAGKAIGAVTQALDVPAGTPVSCEASIVTVVRGRDGEVLDLGGKSRRRGCRRRRRGAGARETLTNATTGSGSTSALMTPARASGPASSFRLLRHGDAPVPALARGRQRVKSVVVPPWCRKSPKVSERSGPRGAPDLSLRRRGAARGGDRPCGDRDEHGCQRQREASHRHPSAPTLLVPVPAHPADRGRSDVAGRWRVPEDKVNVR